MDRPDSLSLSSDEEDDRHNLIEQNERKVPNPTRSTFHIDDHDVDNDNHQFRSRLRRRFTSSFNSLNKRYMFAIFLPLFILVLYFSVDIRSLFSTNFSGVHFDSFSDRLRESELRALYLLRKQQLDLFSLWNHTSNTTTTTNDSSLNNSSLETTQKNLLIEDLKFAVLRQISLNKEIQQLLLSPHKVGNSSSLGFEIDSTDTDLGGFGLNRCGKVDQKFSQRKTIEWKPYFYVALEDGMSFGW